MSKVALTLPSRYFLDALHDADLIAVDYREDTKALSLTFMLDTGSECSISFGEVLYFRVVDFVQQNIVARALLSLTDIASDKGLRYQIEWITSRSDSGPMITEQAVLRLIASIKSGELAMLALVPSAGAELAVLFRSMAWPENV